LFAVSANFVVALAIAGSHFSRIGLDPKKIFRPPASSGPVPNV